MGMKIIFMTIYIKKKLPERLKWNILMKIMINARL